MKKTNLPLHKLLATAIVFSLSACQSDNETTQVNTQSIVTEQPSIDKITLGERHYYLALPEHFNENKAYKLLLAFHGAQGTGITMNHLSAFDQIAEHYIVAYPESNNTDWHTAGQINDNDLDYVDNIIADLQAKYKVLDGELYAVGFSHGGLFTQHLLCNKSDQFKAIASVATSMAANLAQSCTIASPTDYLLVQGNEDMRLPYLGGQQGDIDLISSPEAITLIASLNQISAPLTEVELDENITLTQYENEQTKTHLMTIDKGQHSWDFNAMNTSDYVLDFFQQASDLPLTDHSFLITSASGLSHVRAMGLNNNGPAVVLLSGFNKNFHNDSAWFSLLQPLLAQDYRVYAVDKAGNAFSSYHEQTSYRLLAEDLYAILNNLGETNISLVSFASSNITAQLFQQTYGNDEKLSINNMVWIDPDVLLPHSMAFYKGYPVDWYETYIEDLMPYIESHYFTERSTGKIEKETQEITDMIPEELAAIMDWNYYHAISQYRLTIPGQKTRAMQIAQYPSDLDAVKDITINTNIPTTVIDSDFEQPQIDNATENVEAMIKWQEEGTAWSKLIAEQTGGQYIPLINAQHLVVFENPQIIKQAIDHYLKP